MISEGRKKFEEMILKADAGYREKAKIELRDKLANINTLTYEVSSIASELNDKVLVNLLSGIEDILLSAFLYVNDK